LVFSASSGNLVNTGFRQVPSSSSSSRPVDNRAHFVPTVPISCPFRAHDSTSLAGRFAPQHGIGQGGPK